MAGLLHAFFANPEGVVKLHVREAIEMARAARDFEAIVQGAPATHAQRLDYAANLIEAVLDDPHAVPGGQEELQQNVASIRALALREAQRELEGVAKVLGRVPEVVYPSNQEQLLAGVMERSQHAQLKQRHTQARAAQGDDREGFD